MARLQVMNRPMWNVVLMLSGMYCGEVWVGAPWLSPTWFAVGQYFRCSL